jgi:hypothetical protein
MLISQHYVYEGLGYVCILNLLHFVDKGCPKPFNWSIINLTLYLFITYKCKAGLKWNTGY